MKRWAPRLALRKRLEVIRKWPITKEDGSLLELSNWRRITLLNVDCRVATKVIAKRIESLLPNLVHSDQTGFIKGSILDKISDQLLTAWSIQSHKTYLVS